MVVKTLRKSPYPTNYKIDIANVDLMIAIEVDGGSHTALVRQEQDKKKEEFLTGLGWRVLRFLNKEVEENLSGCVQKVLSII